MVFFSCSSSNRRARRSERSLTSEPLWCATNDAMAGGEQEQEEGGGVEEVVGSRGKGSREGGSDEQRLVGH